MSKIAYSKFQLNENLLYYIAENSDDIIVVDNTCDEFLETHPYCYVIETDGIMFRILG
mgnify:FL=1